jgi:hypothetical protein
VLTVNGSLEQHQELIRATLAKRAHQLFELRGREHALHLEDWVIAEQELVHQNLNGNSSRFCILVGCPRDPDITTILSVTSRSLLVFHSRSTVGRSPELIAVRLLPEDIHPSQTSWTRLIELGKCIYRNSAIEEGNSSPPFPDIDGTES